jgi:signal transduction histidine kinase
MRLLDLAGRVGPPGVLGDVVTSSWMGRRARVAIVVFAGWTLLALFFASQGFVIYLRPGARDMPPMWVFLTVALIEWWGWALLTPLVVWLARRFPVLGARRNLAIHLGAALALAGAKLVLNAVGRAVFMSYDFAILPREIHTGVLTYAVIAGLVTAIDLYRRWARLEALYAEARLKALTAQLQPHFLFNTLNAIQSLVHDDPEAADRMIGHLGDLLRATLRVVDAQEVPLEQELAILVPYIEIQRARHPDRLSVRVEVAPEAMAARVPAMVLQPLVENAIRHGIAPRAAPGTVEIRAARANGELLLEVRDDGVGLAEPHEEGVGLGNTRQRLDELYGSRHRMAIHPGERGGTVVKLAIPQEAA